MSDTINETPEMELARLRRESAANLEANLRLRRIIDASAKRSKLVMQQAKAFEDARVLRFQAEAQVNLQRAIDAELALLDEKTLRENERAGYAAAWAAMDAAKKEEIT